MGEKAIQDRLSFVSDGKITHYEINQKGELEITYDPHGLDVHHAIRAIRNMTGLFQCCPLELHVIHGYNRGTAIKERIWKEDWQRLQSMQSPPTNPGITNMRFTSAY